MHPLLSIQMNRFIKFISPVLSLFFLLMMPTPGNNHILPITPVKVHAFSNINHSYLNNNATIISDIKKQLAIDDAALLTDSTGKILFSQNADKKLIPASTLKILTALTALHFLGKNHHFQTEFYMDQRRNLKIKGYGDPFLISEIIQEISKAISQRISGFNDLVLDHSYFDESFIPGITSSLEPYDAPNGALCVNFNTVNFKTTTNGKIVSAEPQTPLLPFVLDKIKESGLQQGRILLSNEGHECTLYAGHLFMHFFTRQGLTSSGNIRIGSIEKGTDNLLFSYTSGLHMEDIISRLLEYSNNFIANQLLLAMAAKVTPPGRLSKGIEIINSYARDILMDNTIHIVEGAGISRQNRLSTNSMMGILNQFEPYHHLMKKEGYVYFKTGTLNGIRTRAGFIEDRQGGLMRFVIFINTPGKTDSVILNQLIRFR